VATLEVHPHVLDNYRTHAISGFIPLIVVASMVALPIFVRRRCELAAFLSSGTYLAAMLAGAAAALYPTVLPASGDSSRSLTISAPRLVGTPCRWDSGCGRAESCTPSATSSSCIGCREGKSKR